MSCDVPTSLLCKNIHQSFGDFEPYLKFSNLIQFVICTTIYLNISLKIPPKLGDLVVVYNATLCKNPLVFFEKFEQIILIFILVQLDDLYYNHIWTCPFTHDSFSCLQTTLPNPYVQESGPIGVFLVHETMPFTFCPEMVFPKTRTIKFLVLTN